MCDVTREARPQWAPGGPHANPARLRVYSCGGRVNAPREPEVEDLDVTSRLEARLWAANVLEADAGGTITSDAGTYLLPATTQRVRRAKQSPDSTSWRLTICISGTSQLGHFVAFSFPGDVSCRMFKR